jgi:hypothetical protein
MAGGQEEVMRLVAKLQDKMSPQLRQMQRSLRSLAASTGDFHKTSIKAHTIAFNELRRSVTDVGDCDRGVFTPAACQANNWPARATILPVPRCPLLADADISIEPLR